MNQNMEAKQTQTWSAVIIRKDGRRQNLGVIAGGSRVQKVVAFFRIKLINLKQWLMY